MHANSVKPGVHASDSSLQHAPSAGALPQKPGSAHVEKSPPYEPADCTHANCVRPSTHCPVSASRQHAPVLPDCVGSGAVGIGVGDGDGFGVAGTGVGAGDGLGVGTSTHAPVSSVHDDDAAKTRPIVEHWLAFSDSVHESSGATPNWQHGSAGGGAGQKPASLQSAADPKSSVVAFG